MKKLIISLMVLLGLSASAQNYYVGQFSGLDVGNTGIVNQAGQTIDQRATTAAANVVSTGAVASVYGQSSASSNLVGQAFLSNYNIKYRANGGRPIMAFTGEASSPNQSYTSTTNQLIPAIQLGYVAAGYNTYLADEQDLVAHTNIGGVVFPLITNSFPSAGEVGGVGYLPLINNFLKPNGITGFGVLFEIGPSAAAGIGMAPYWDRDVMYATTNWGVSVWSLYMDETNYNPYWYDMERTLQAIEATGSNCYIFTGGFVGVRNFGLPNGELTNINYFSPSYFAPYVNCQTVGNVDPTSYQNFFNIWFTYVTPYLALEAPGYSISETYCLGWGSGVPEQWGTMFQMEALTESPLVLSIAGSWNHYGVNTAWLPQDAALIAIDQNVNRPPITNPLNTNGVTFWVGAATFDAVPNTWYVGVWNTNTYSTNLVTVPLSALGLYGYSTNQPTTIWDATMQATAGYVTNGLWTMTNSMNGGSGYNTNLSAGDATVYVLKRGLVSDWSGGTSTMTSGHPLATFSPGTQNSSYAIGFNRDYWLCTTTSGYTNVAVSSYGGITPTNFISTAFTNMSLTYTTWPATNFTTAFSCYDGFYLPATYTMTLSAYTNGVLATSVTVPGSTVSQGASSNLTVNLTGVTTLTLTESENAAMQGGGGIPIALVNPVLQSPYSTVYQGNNVVAIPTYFPVTGMTTNIQFTDGLISTNTLYFTNGVLQGVTKP